MKKFTIISSVFFFSLAFLFSIYTHRQPTEIKVEYPSYDGTMKENKPLHINSESDRILNI